MSTLLYWLLSAIVAVLQALPLRLVAFAGRVGGFIWWLVDFKHRRLVLKNLALSFPEQSTAWLRAVGRETFQRIAENGFAAVKTGGMDLKQIEKVCEVTGLEKIPRRGSPGAPLNCIGVIGHFGNFELYVTIGARVSGWIPATTYRGMNQPGLNRIVQKLRERSKCQFFERRSEGQALKEALRKGGLLLGLLSDQRSGQSGVMAPFMGRPCNTTAAPALFALRYDARLFPIICYRVALGRWRMEVGEEIQVSTNGEPRSIEAIMTDVNREFETAVRRDPANWFWVHDRWKYRKIRGERLSNLKDEPRAGRAVVSAPPSVSGEPPGS